MGEREARDTGATARSLSVVHYLERTQDAAASLIAGLVDRSAAAAEGNVVFIAVTPSPDDALSLCEAVHAHRRNAGRALMPITSAARGRRVVAIGSGLIAGSATDLTRLVAESRLVLPHLHTLVLLWPEEMLADSEPRQALESIIAEVPRSAERVALCAARSTELSQFLERAMWRARELDHVTAETTSGTPLRVIVAPQSEHLRALRTVLDAFDPPSAVLIAFSDESEAAARNSAAIFDSQGALVRVSRGVAEERYALGIIFDDVPPADALTAVANTVDELVVIVRPVRLAALQKVAPNSTPMTWTGALANARSVQDALRDEIRSFAGSGAHLPWVPIVEPLLEGLDAVEVAATALALLDRERRKAKKAAAVQTATSAPASRQGATARPESRRRDERDERPARGFDKKRPWSKESRGSDTRRDRPRERDDRPRPDDSGRRGPRDRDIERVPRAARESREWTERGERLRHSRRGPRGRDTG